MTRIVVHAGFHKTGTTSLQDFLRANGAALAGHLRFYGKADFLGAGAKARVYAQRPYPWRLWRFRLAFRRFLASVEPGGTVVLSRETFSGGMPGHRRLGGTMMTSYSSPARALARVILAELRRRFGPGADITFFYTTRASEDWFRSVHGHLLRSIRLTDDFETFRARFPDRAGPVEEAAEMAHALALAPVPVPVVTAALEDYADHREGPAAALLDLLEVPAGLRATLKPAPHSNAGQPKALRERFRALNTGRLGRTALKREKQALLQQVTDR